MSERDKLPLISVVMTTYNGEKFLEQQLDSVLQQTYPNIELIVIDDRSTDSTYEILSRYAERYPKMKLYENEVNLGFIKNFERGCGLANGEWIALCDQDDYWHPDKLSKMAAAIGNAPMIYCNSLLCNENMESIGVYISERAVFQPIKSPLQQAVFCRIYGHASLITKALTRKATPFLDAIPHDWWLSFVATLHGEIRYLDEPLVHYRQHASNLYGAVGGKRRKKSKEQKWQEKMKEIKKIRTRIHAFYNICPEHLQKEKAVLKALMKSYSSFSFTNNIRRMLLFFRYEQQLLFVKKRSAFRKWLFCLKMFVMIK
ncbi:MAG: glycosyltransferase family 2 protein [Flavisolibacter sp.]